MAEIKALLKFDNISLSFGGITALKNVSFDVLFCSSCFERLESLFMGTFFYPPPTSH